MAWWRSLWHPAEPHVSFTCLAQHEARERIAATPPKATDAALVRRIAGAGKFYRPEIRPLSDRLWRVS